MSAHEYVVLAFWGGVVVLLLWAAARIAARQEANDLERQRRKRARIADEQLDKALDEFEEWLG